MLSDRTPPRSISATHKTGHPPFEPRFLAATASALRHNLATQDYALLTMHSYLLVRSLAAPDGPDAALSRPITFGLWLVTVIALVATRGEVLPPGPLRAGLYRIGAFLPAIGSYFGLRWVLRAIEVDPLDAQLLAFERAILGETPAVWMERWATSAAVEWFAFFYALYFAWIGLHVIGYMVFDETRRGGELLVGATIILATGHITYTLVPGVGPFAHIPGAFAEPLPGGLWWGVVQSLVATAGALLDIFPSLHTAYPALFMLHAIRFRRAFPYRRIWIVTTFVAANMIVSTVFLRWHYAVDVLAGLALAVAAQAIGIATLRRDSNRRGQPLFERLRPAGMGLRAYVRLVGIVSVQVAVLIGGVLFWLQRF
ncbi:MAG: phosphatase PAP2 family protein [Myxococcales bacterium]|nr:phosphatase PAP2 family protein [Myxococcales bacterium]